MIRVQFLESISGINFNFGRGGYYTLPTSEAEYYIREGIAKKAEETKEKDKSVRPLKKPKSKAKRVSTRPV